MNNKNNSLIELVSISKTFKMGSDNICVLKNTNMVVNKKECVALIGPSGSGKSTLLHIAGLLDSMDNGKVFIKGKDCSKITKPQIDNIHQNEIGFIYQTNNLLNDFTAIENIMIPLMIRGVSKINARAEAIKILEEMNLSDRALHYPTQLSGGQCQRIAIARAIVTKPSILLADEPTGNLDPNTGDVIFNQLLSIVKERQICLIIATHNPTIAKKCDKVYIISDRQAIEINKKNQTILKKNKDTKELMKQFD